MIRKPLLKLGSLVLCAAMLLMPAAACAGVALEADIGYDGVITSWSAWDFCGGALTSTPR